MSGLYTTKGDNTMRTYIQAIGDAPDRFATESKDCTVRALSNCLGVSYKAAHAIMAKHAGRKPNSGPQWNRYSDTMLSLGFKGVAYGSGATAKYLQSSKGFKSKKGITIAKLLPLLPERAVVGIRGHVFAVVNGQILDSGPMNGSRRVDVVFC